MELYKSDPNADRQKALKLAVAAAVANAKAVAGGADVTVKDILTITDQPRDNPFGFGGGMAAGHGDILGETDVTVSVSVTFTY